MPDELREQYSYEIDWMERLASVAAGKAEKNDVRILTEYNEIKRKGVDVIVPVYGDPEATRVCLRSVLGRTYFPFRLIVVNDCSPFPQMGEVLEEVLPDSRVLVLENSENLGFPSSVNRGMSFSERDVVILNSDTEVSDGWLESMVRAAACNPKAATVTPYSSNSGIFTLFPPEVSEKHEFKELSRAVRLLFDGSYLRVPTGHGFCMLIRRKAILAAGYFDSDSFGRGYGEETDFCLRCKDLGFYHIVDPATYIYHGRGRSFKEEADQLRKDHEIILEKLHPEYPRLKEAFKKDTNWLRKKELLQTRVKKYFEFCDSTDLQIARREKKNPRKRYLTAMHRGAGGSVLNRIDLMNSLAEGMDCYLLTGDWESLILELIVHSERIPVKRYHLKEKLDFRTFERSDMSDIYAEILFKYQIDYVNMSHLLGQTFDLVKECRKREIPSFFVFHDYYAVCPCFTLLDPDEQYCKGECHAGGRECRLSKKWFGHRHIVAEDILPAWRLAMPEYLALFDRLAAPSRFCADLVSKIYPALERKINVIEHGRDFDESWKYGAVYPAEGEKIRLLIPGNIGRSKGASFLKKLVDRDREKRLEIHIVGQADGTLLKCRLVLHGEYSRESLPSLIKEIRPHYGFIPSIYPETYCHTLTEMWAAGLPVIVFSVGVPQERMEKEKGGWICQSGDVEEFYRLVTEQISEKEYLEKVRIVEDLHFPSVRDMGNAYCAMLRQINVTEEHLREQPEEESHLRHICMIRATEILKSDSGETTVPAERETALKMEKLQETVRKYQVQLIDLQAALDDALSCTRRQAGDIIVDAFKHPERLWRLPWDLWRLFREKRRIVRSEKVKSEEKPQILMPHALEVYDEGGKDRKDGFKGLMEVQYASNRILRTVSVIVCVHNAPEDIHRCIQSLTDTRSFPFEWIIVDDGSEEETKALLKESARKTGAVLIRNEQAKGYTCAANEGIRCSHGEYVILLNSDTIVTCGWIEKMLKAFDANTDTGILSPLSNAATWQSIPEVFEGEKWAVNPLPDHMNAEMMNQIAEHKGEPVYPRLGCVNGFCLMIRRKVIDRIGLLDEVNFPQGYGEEVDYCIRAAAAGYASRVLDDTFIFHAKTRSFTADRRTELTARAAGVLTRKHGKAYTSLDKASMQTPEMEAVRVAFVSDLKEVEKWFSVLREKRIAFLIPAQGGSGGANSICQEAQGLRRMGLSVNLLNERQYRDVFLENYPEWAKDTLWYEESPVSFANDFDICICSVFFTVRQAKEMQKNNPKLKVAYYVQDYEPFFFSQGDPLYEVARDSYELIPDALLFAKTDWICGIVAENHHGRCVERVKASVNRRLYNPYRISGIAGNERIRIAAMIRPSTSRRRAGHTLQLLTRLHEEMDGKIEIHCFGCTDDAIRKCFGSDCGWMVNHGMVTPLEAASLLAQSDIFIDMSSYQAFGRTGIEAMALGCIPVLPKHGGTDEYATDGVNALVVDTLDMEECFHAVVSLLKDSEKRIEMVPAGLETVRNYSVMNSAWSEAVLFGKWLTGGGADGEN